MNIKQIKQKIRRLEKKLDNMSEEDLNDWIGEDTRDQLMDLKCDLDDLKLKQDDKKNKLKESRETRELVFTHNSNGTMTLWV